MVDHADLRFDLIVATVGRTDELDKLLASLEAQRHRAFRVLVVDQNADDRLLSVLALHGSLDVVHLRSALGLNRARNVGLAHADAEIVAFPDDDCTYAPDLLERVAERFAGDDALDGFTGRTAEPGGAASDRWPSAPRILDLNSVWHGGNSASMFLRRSLVEELGCFDEQIGFGSGNPWELGDETDLLVRALLRGARIEQDPRLVVHHAVRELDGAALDLASRRSGAGVGYILGKNPVPARVTARMFARAAGGVVVSLAHRDRAHARAYAITLRWRLSGYLAGRRARRSRRSANSAA